MNAIQRTATALFALMMCVGPPLAWAQSLDRTVAEEQFGGRIGLSANAERVSSRSRAGGIGWC